MKRLIIQTRSLQGKVNHDEKKKRMREGGSQADDEALSDGEQHEHGCVIMCNTKLNDMQGKLDKLISVIPEIQNLKI